MTFNKRGLLCAIAQSLSTVTNFSSLTHELFIVDSRFMKNDRTRVREREWIATAFWPGDS